VPLSDFLFGISHVTNAVGAMATSVQRKAQHLLSAHAQAYSGTGPDQPKGGTALAAIPRLVSGEFTTRRLPKIGPSTVTPYTKIVRFLGR
jgi:hypothetical protein